MKCSKCDGDMVERGKIGYDCYGREVEADWIECSKCGFVNNQVPEKPTEEDPPAFIPKPSDFELKLKSSMEEFVKKHQLACKELDEKQLAEAIRQALLCGDFVKYVTRDSRQQFYYIPFREIERIRSLHHELILSLRTEVNCRIEHGAESGGHLEYVQEKLDEILKIKTSFR